MSRPLLVILRPLGLGDLLTGIPVVRALARAFPRHRRVLAAPAALEPLALQIGAIDELVPAGPLRPLPPALDRPDVAVDLHGKGAKSHRILLACRPRRLIAFANAFVPESEGSPAWRADEHEVDRWCRLLSESGIPADPSDLDLERPAREPPPHAVGATLVHPGAASAARRWPVERFAAVARAEHARGRRVMVTGSASELPLAGKLARLAGLPASAVHAGRTDLLDLAALVAAAGRVVCGDTGVAHLATALGTPSVVLFGPISPEHWGPPPERPQHVALWAGRAGDPHADRPDRGLLELDAGDVLKALRAA